MKHFESRPVKVSQSADAIYGKFSDFNNFRGILPDQIDSFACTETSCTFTAKGMPDIVLDMKERVPGKRVVYSTHEQRPIDVKLGMDICNNDGDASEIKLFIDADVDGVTSAMLSKPFQNLLEMMANKLEKGY